MAVTYKMFRAGLTCRGYQFRPGAWAEEKEANCVQNGFHSAKNPLDCLSYYPEWEGNECWICEVGGDIDEDGRDSKVSSTRLRPIRRLTLEEFVEAAILYIAEHPKAEVNSRVYKEPHTPGKERFVIVMCEEPKAMGAMGDVLGLVRTDTEGKAVEAAVYVVGKHGRKPGEWYGIEDGEEA